MPLNPSRGPIQLPGRLKLGVGRLRFQPGPGHTKAPVPLLAVPGTRLQSSGALLDER